MLMRSIVACAVLAAALALTAAPVRACEGLDCRPRADAAPVSTPLQLNRFMRRHAKTGHLKSSPRTSKRSVARTARKRASLPSKRINTVKRRRSLNLDHAVARAPTLAVRVVASDELNKIDLAADSAAAGQAPMAFAATHSVWPAAGNVTANIERRAKPAAVAHAERALIVAAEGQREAAAAEPPAAPENWVERAWIMLRNGWSTAARWLGG